MKVFHFIILIFLLPFYASSQDKLYEKIKLDTDFLEYKKVENAIKAGLLEKRFIIPDNFRSLAIQNGKVVDEASLIKSLEKEGMSNAKEYYDLVKKQNIYMIKTIQKYPEFNSLSPMEKSRLLMKLLNSN
jgi:hypothetical protein